MAELKAMMILHDENQNTNEPHRESKTEFIEQLLGQEGVENVDDIDQIVGTRGMSVVKKRSNVMTKQQYCQMLRITNAEQRDLIHKVIHRLHSCGDDGQSLLQVFFTGLAGCGKTYTLKLLMETYNRYIHQNHSLRNDYVACASTGKAAVAINGTTVHSAFRLTISRATTQLSTENLQAYRNMFVGVKAVIIDEISMVGSDVLQKINQRLQQTTGVYDQPFGGLHEFLCGDFCQLPPVCATPCFTVRSNQLGGPILWQVLHYFPLIQVVRQTDEIFSTILTKVGDGVILSDDKIALIEARYKSERWCRENLPNIIRLYYNTEVDYCNRSTMNNAYNYITTDIMLGYSSAFEKQEWQRKLHKMNVAETDGLPYMLTLDVGQPHMITANIDVVDELVNGQIGLLRHIERQQLNADHSFAEARPSTSAAVEQAPAEGDIITLWFEFEQETTGINAKIESRPHVLSKPNSLSSKWVLVYKGVTNINLTKTIKCKRKQFPCAPACAITIHKSQGGTFDKIVYKYSPNQRCTKTEY